MKCQHADKHLYVCPRVKNSFIRILSAASEKQTELLFFVFMMARRGEKNWMLAFVSKSSRMLGLMMNFRHEMTRNNLFASNCDPAMRLQLFHRQHNNNDTEKYVVKCMSGPFNFHHAALFAILCSFLCFRSGNDPFLSSMRLCDGVRRSL